MLANCHVYIHTYQQSFVHMIVHEAHRFGLEGTRSIGVEKLSLQVTGQSGIWFTGLLQCRLQEGIRGVCVWYF